MADSLRRCTAYCWFKIPPVGLSKASLLWLKHFTLHSESSCSNPGRYSGQEAQQGGRPALPQPARQHQWSSLAVPSGSQGWDSHDSSEEEVRKVSSSPSA